MKSVIRDVSMFIFKYVILIALFLGFNYDTFLTRSKKMVNYIKNFNTVEVLSD